MAHWSARYVGRPYVPNRDDCAQLAADGGRAGTTIEVENMFGKLKDWRRIHTRYDRCAHTFMSAICIAATVIFWLPQ